MLTIKKINQRVIDKAIAVAEVMVVNNLEEDFLDQKTFGELKVFLKEPKVFLLALLLMTLILNYLTKKFLLVHKNCKHPFIILEVLFK